MRKGKIFLLVGGLAIIATTSTMFLTACDKGEENYGLIVDKLGQAVSAVKENKDKNNNFYFYERGYTVNQKTFTLYSSNFNVNLSGLDYFKTEISNYDLNSELDRLFALYELPFGYSFMTIDESYDLMKSNIIQYSSLTKIQKDYLKQLESSIDDFNNRLNQHYRNLESFSTYVGQNGYDNTDPLILNALYNFEIEYQNFVRGTINLAVSANNAVNNVYTEIAYKEEVGDKTLSKDQNLTVAGKYFKTGTVAEAVSDNKLRIVEDDKILEAEIDPAFWTANYASNVQDGKVNLAQTTFFKYKAVLMPKTTSVKVVAYNEGKNTVEYIKDGICYTATITKSGEQDDSDVNKTIELTEDTQMQISYRQVPANSSIKILSQNGENYNVEFVDSSQILWKAEINKSNIVGLTENTKAGDNVVLKNITNFNYSGRRAKAGEKIKILSVAGNRHNIETLGDVVWQADIGLENITKYRSITTNLNLQVIDSYYAFNVESLNSKRIQLNGFEGANTLKAKVKQGYDNSANAFKEVMRSILSSNYYQKTNKDKINEVISQQKTFTTSTNEAKNALNNLNISSIKYGSLGENDADTFDANLATAVKYFSDNLSSNQQKGLLKTWFEYYSSIF